MGFSAQEVEFVHELEVPILMGLLRKNTFLTSSSAINRLEQIFSGTSDFKIAHSDGGANNSIVVTWNGYIFAAYIVNKPIPDEEFFAAVSASPDKTRLGKIVKRHRAHLVISTLNSPSNFGEAIDLSLVLMRFSATLAQLCDNMVWFWAGSQKLVFKEAFEDDITKSLQALEKRGSPDAWELLPINTWIDIRIFSDEPLVAGRTEGFKNFTDYELETNFIDKPAVELRQHISAVVNYLFMFGCIKPFLYLFKTFFQPFILNKLLILQMWNLLKTVRSIKVGVAKCLRALVLMLSISTLAGCYSHVTEQDVKSAIPPIFEIGDSVYFNSQRGCYFGEFKLSALPILDKFSEDWNRVFKEIPDEQKPILLVAHKRHSKKLIRLWLFLESP